MTWPVEGTGWRAVEWVCRLAFFALIGLFVLRAVYVLLPAPIPAWTSGASAVAALVLLVSGVALGVAERRHRVRHLQAINEARRALAEQHRQARQAPDGAPGPADRWAPRGSNPEPAD